MAVCRSEKPIQTLIMKPKETTNDQRKHFRCSRRSMAESISAISDAQSTGQLSGTLLRLRLTLGDSDAMLDDLSQLIIPFSSTLHAKYQVVKRKRERIQVAYEYLPSISEQSAPKTVPQYTDIRTAVQHETNHSAHKTVPQCKINPK